MPPEKKKNPTLSTAAIPENAALKSETALAEEKTLEFWRANKIFLKTLAKKSPKGEFVFYEGPPTANAAPAIHHLEARAFKDIIPRYKTMQGFHVRRKGGWDTHGLPVELQVEKKLGLKSKKEIENFGIEAFNKKCKENVWEQIDLWEKFTDRIGYWVDQENPYVTYEKTYMESVWNILKTVSREKVSGKDLLYKDYKVLPWCPRCGTALSSHELALGYEDVKDLSVTVKFKVKGEENTYLLAWTTTPWTLPGNVALAVKDDLEYLIIPNDSIATQDSTLVKNNQILEASSVSKGKYIINKDIFWRNIIGNDGMIELRALLDPYPEIEVVMKYVNDFEGFVKKYNIKVVKGSELVGLEYEPFYPYLSDKFKNKDEEAFGKAYKVYPADFVTTTDGTGIVHTAVMYGQEDFELGTKIGLPKFHLVSEDGHFLSGMNFFSNRYVKEKDGVGKPTLDVDIINDLKQRNLFFKQENYKHSYPHCWRCKTPLIYFARDSWYIRMSSLRDKLVRENEGINWEPDFIKNGRFGEWLREAKDWAISRERYWGTPLPVWESETGERVVVGSLAELKEMIPKRNNYFLVRHGESESNASGGIIRSKLETLDSLTELGEKQIKKISKAIGKKNIDLIITSPFSRAKQTAAIIAKEINFEEKSGKILEDEKIGEMRVNNWEGKTWDEYQAQFSSIQDRFKKDTGPDENYENLRARVASFMYETDAKYQGKNILIVGHGAPLNLIDLSSKGYSVEEIADHYYENDLDNAEFREMDWRNLPHNEKFEIDLHRPFIDVVELFDKNGRPLKRVKEVLDVWFDSGAMPFAQSHFPFASGASGKKIAYPADYISEAIDQTRGWFYTLHAIGILMGKGKAYKNVICLGHILDTEGKKMSKSLGNIVNPWTMIDKYGVDALRMWMYTVNQPGDSKNFDERSVDDIVKKVFNLATNIAALYELYSDGSVEASDRSSNILDKWIIARLNQFVGEGTEFLNNYKVFEAARATREFLADFSTWYIRRSRDRFKSENIEERNEALSTTRFVLLDLSKYMAPFTPFYADFLYGKVKSQSGEGEGERGNENSSESVHLEDWPKAGRVDEKILEEMAELRRVVSLALELRAKAGLKIRQPIAKSTVKSAVVGLKEEFTLLFQDELNVKEVIFDKNLPEEVVHDTNITAELKEEGNLRELTRFIQDLRKKKGLNPGEKTVLRASAEGTSKIFLQKFEKEIMSATSVGKIEYIVSELNDGLDRSVGETIEIDGMKFIFSL